jgi:hypothetical protein
MPIKFSIPLVIPLFIVFILVALYYVSYLEYLPT